MSRDEGDTICELNDTHHRKEVFLKEINWNVQASSVTHVWLDTEVSGCIAASSALGCRKSGPRKKCTVCKIVAHEKCIRQEVDTLPRCRMTFRDATSRGSMDANPPHHIVYCTKQHGRCEPCGKGLQSMLSYKTQKDNAALICTWCKRGFHTKDCSKDFLKEKHCDLGPHKNVIVPPSWIVKLPPRKYSRMVSNRRDGFQGTMGRFSRERRAFVVKPEAGGNKVPLLVFVNPRSGGNQGAKILKKYQYKLNPRQVFDLSSGGPSFGLDLYRNVHNLRILVCGGDGSVGWVLSEIDRLKMDPSPSVCVLPLGTGNDLSRVLGWGGGYADEPLSKILVHIEEGGKQKLDRWDLDVTSNSNAETETENCDDNAQSTLTLNVMNNYFSMGADADVALQFHESREANPEKFNSRVWNKFYYAKKGGQAVLKRKNIDLHKCIESFVCDGTDLTSRIRELKPISIAFLNIPSFAGGTSPWGNPTNGVFLPQSCDDGYLEVVGLTAKSLASTHVGDHGIRLFQCKTALFYTNTKIAMQVDGEPCRMKPSRVFIKRRNQATMVAKKKPRPSVIENLHLTTHFALLPVSPRPVSMQLYYMNYPQYNSLVKYHITEIQNVAQDLGVIEVDTHMQLNIMREKLETMKAGGQLSLESKLSEEWCFLDAKWTSRIYRIDDAQEYFLRVADIVEEGIYVLDLKKDTDMEASLDFNLPGLPKSSQVQRKVDTNTLPIIRETRPPLKKISQSFDFSDLCRHGVTNEDGSYDLVDTDSGSDNAISNFSANEDEDVTIPEDQDGKENALFDAARRGQLNRFQTIAAANTSLMARDGSGRTPLHVAARYGRKEIVNYIVSNVTQYVINMADEKNAHTPLHVSAQHRRRSISRTLVAHGASTTIRDADGQSPRLLALNSKDIELAKYLQNQERMEEIHDADHETIV